MKTIEQIREYIENELTESEQIAIWNAYCEQNAYYDEQLHNMEEFDEYVGYDNTPTQVLESVSSDFHITEHYFYCDIYGIESTDYPEDIIRFDEVAKYIYDNDNELDCNELRDFMDEDEQEE